jgi:HlyD family secretion protein
MLAPNTDIQSLLKIDTGSKRFAFLRRPVVWAALAILLIAAGIYWWTASGTTSAVAYTTAPAKRGDITIAVSATGTVEPVNEVDISSELSGAIAKVNVDFNDTVTAGEVLAVINTDKLTAQTNSARADLEAAKAAVTQAQATVTETLQTLRRIQPLANLNYSSRQDLETAQATYDRAVAALASANAQVKVKEANVAAYETDLGKAEIKSPIKGVVLNRTVDPGSTVAASLSAPVLFIIAEDLSQMRVLVAVDEADAGSVVEGQDATFTVAAFSDRTFAAKVIQLRYASTTTANVVTYTAVLSVDNSDLAIRPGMTATADIVVKQAKGVLLIPNAALRYAPAGATTTAVTTTPGRNRNILQRLFPRPPSSSTSRTDLGKDVPAGQKRIWVLKDGAPMAVLITPGSTDGSWTEVASGAVAEGDAVITDSTATN